MMEAPFCNWVPNAWGLSSYWGPPNPPEIIKVAEEHGGYLFWEPYAKAAYQQDFRDLIDAFEKGDPRTFKGAVRLLLAEQMRKPVKHSRKTQHKDSYPYMMEVMLELSRNPEISEYRAMHNVINRSKTTLDENTMKTWWRAWKKRQGLK